MRDIFNCTLLAAGTAYLFYYLIKGGQVEIFLTGMLIGWQVHLVYRKYKDDKEK